MQDTRSADPKFHVERSEGGEAGQIVDHPARALVIPQPAKLPAVPQFSIDEMKQIAEAIARGGLFGSSDPNAVLTLCMLAHAEGQHPAVVFRDYNIIKGRPSKTAEAMQRDFLLGGGRIEWHYLCDTKADATFSHPQGGKARIVWDLDRAEKACLGQRGRNNEPSMWEKYPRQMLRSRTISEGVRTIWPAATGGMYEDGEVLDIVDETPGDRRRVDNSPPALTDEQTRANMEIWTQRQIERVGECQDFEALSGLQAAGHDRMRRMARSNHSDLYAKVQEAYEAKEHELNGYDPETGMTRSERETVPDEDDHTDPYSVFQRRLEQCRNLKDVDKVDRDFCKISARYDDETQGLIFDLITRTRKKLRGGRK